jgi:hypothetical protein
MRMEEEGLRKKKGCLGVVLFNSVMWSLAQGRSTSRSAKAEAEAEGERSDARVVTADAHDLAAIGTNGGHGERLVGRKVGMEGGMSRVVAQWEGEWYRCLGNPKRNGGYWWILGGKELEARMSSGDAEKPLVSLTTGTLIVIVIVIIVL